MNGAVPTSEGFDAEVSLDPAVLGSLTPRADIRIYYTPRDTPPTFSATLPLDWTNLPAESLGTIFAA